MELKEFSNQQIAEELQQREDLSFLLLDCSDEADPTGYRYLKENHKGYLLPLLFSSVSSLCGIHDELKHFFNDVKSLTSMQDELYQTESTSEGIDLIFKTDQLAKQIDSRMARINTILSYIENRK